jgi:ribosomal silencing factor RsfS
MIITSGRSQRHVGSIADKVIQEFKRPRARRPRNLAGNPAPGPQREARWPELRERLRRSEIDLFGKTSIADAMIITSGRSQRHVGSIADKVIHRPHVRGLGRDDPGILPGILHLGLSGKLVGLSFVSVALACLEDMKAEETVEIDLFGKTSIADAMIITILHLGLSGKLVGLSFVRDCVVQCRPLSMKAPDGAGTFPPAS